MEAQPLGKGIEGRGGGPHLPLPNAKGRVLEPPLEDQLLYECVNLGLRFSFIFPCLPHPTPSHNHQGGLDNVPLSLGSQGRASSCHLLEPMPPYPWTLIPCPRASDWEPPQPIPSQPLPSPPHPQHVVLVFSYRCSRK